MSVILSVEAHKRNYFDSAIADVYRAIKGGCLLSSFTLLFCIIDALSIIEYEKKKKESPFNSWINHWLLPLNIYYTGREKFLYAARCSLVHTYGVSDSQKSQRISIQFSHTAMGSHLVVLNRGPEESIKSPDFYPGDITLNLPELLAEVTLAAFLFFDNLKTEDENSSRILRMKNLMKVHFPVNPPQEQLEIISKKNYSTMDRCLSIFDQPQAPTKDELLLEILQLKVFRGF
jgi:hypothetical protein